MSFGRTRIGNPSSPNQKGKIRGPCVPVVVVAAYERGEPLGASVRVVVANWPDSTSICAGTVMDPATTKEESK
jgi:hypothetical protein